MKTENLKQGTPEWHAYRRSKFNASDAAAMMGCSPYKSRQDLVRELATGISTEPDARTQRIFDEGHRVEALARPLAEEIIGEDLYPVTGSNDKLSASFDGLTLMFDINWEHKMLNARLREAMTPGCTGDALPMDYQVQMEHQHMVAGCDKTLFMASQWDGDQLVEVRHCWYTPNADLATAIKAGWEQLEKDVAAYVPTEAQAVAVVAEPMQALPAVSVKVEGQITIKDNFGAFEVALRDFLEHRLIRTPKTDQDFADLDVQIKAMKGAEAALETAEAGWIAQIEAVSTAKARKDMLHKLVRDNRLLSEKLLTSEKDRRRLEIVTNGQTALREHIASLNERLGKPYMPAIAADFPGAIKGMRSLSSMEDAVATVLAKAKIDANAAADRIDANLKTLRELAANHAFLFADTPAIVHKAADDFAALVKLRIAEHTAAEEKRIEAERELIRKQEADRAEREVRADHERRRRAVAAIVFPAPEPEPEPAQPVAPVARPALTPVATIAQPVQRAEPPAPIAQPAQEEATVRLGEICTRVGQGFTMTAAFVETVLGIKPAAVDKAAKLYTPTDERRIYAALIKHLQGLQMAQAA